jgi:peptide/nickel transport system permease protein
MMRVRTTVLVVALAVHGIVLVAPWLVPYDPATQQRLLAFAPPSRFHLVDAKRQWHLRPFVCAIAPSPDAPFHYLEDCSEIYPLRFFLRRTTSAGFMTRRTVHVFGVEEPGDLFLFGTDEFGRDVFSRVLVGARISLTMAISAVCLSLALGVLFGSLAGYAGGVVDAIVSGATELALALPWLYLLLAVRAALPLSLPPTEAFVIIMLMLGAIGWARPARLVRAVVATAKANDYVAAA